MSFDWLRGTSFDSTGRDWSGSGVAGENGIMGLRVSEPSGLRINPRDS